MSDETAVYTASARGDANDVDRGSRALVTANQSRSSGLCPVWESMHEELSRKSGQWLSDLVRWYEADWLVALEGGERPDASHVLSVLDAERRETVESVFIAIDTRYESAWKSRETVAGTDDATIDLSARGMDHLPPTLPPRESEAGSQADEPTINFTSTGVRSATAVDEPTIAHQTGSKDPSLDFSFGQLESKRSTGSRPGASSKEAFPEIPGYRIDRVLGRGGMGIVYLAHQLGIERPVALKMIIGGKFASEATIERFLAEGRAVGKLQHENIVRIYDSGWFKDMPYFSLEFIDGPSLSDKIRGEPLEPLEAATLGVSLSQALHYAHESGIVHRDLKPANVLVTQAGVAKVTDFGLAKLEDEQNAYSQTGDVVGTPGYMAPEQARGEKSVSVPADVYGLGAILYCMLSGRPPFVAAKASDTLLQVLTQEAIPVGKLQPSIPRDLETICMKCLEKEPEKRYASAQELAAELQRFINGEPIMARPVTRVERAWRWAKRKPVIAGLSATAALLAGILMIGGPAVALVINQQKSAIATAKQAADDNALKAQKAQGVAELNEKRAEENAEEAKKNAEAAQQQQMQAIDAIKSLVFQVQREMTDRPRLQGIRKAILDVARDGLKRMEASGTDVHARNIIQASIHRRLGDINLELGSAESAQREYQKGLDVLNSLNDENQLKNARHNLSTIYDLLGQSLRKQGKLAEAEKYWKLCLEQRRAWAQESNNNLDVLQNVAATLGKLDVLSREQGRLKDARSYLEEALKYRAEYVKQRPGQFDPIKEMLGTERQLALLQYQEGDAEGGLAKLRDVVDRFQKLADSNSQSQANVWNVQLFKADVGVRLLCLRRHEEAAQLLEQVVEKEKVLLEEDPDKLPFREALASSTYALAVTYERQRRDEQAQEMYLRALELANWALERDPDNLSRQMRVALFQARVKKFSDAWKLAKTLRTVTTDPGKLYDMAGVFAQLSLDPSEPAAKAARDTAFALLTKARQGGFERMLDLATDPDLDPIRQDPRFETLKQTQSQ